MRATRSSAAPASPDPDVDLVVVGLGYVGLPLAREACRAGLRTIGLDVHRQTVDALNDGRSHVDDISDADVAAMRAGDFVATAEAVCVARADTVVICVPTPLSPEGGPDLGAVRAAVAAVGRHLRRGQLVVLESTTYPGTTEEVVQPMLEAESGLRAGTDFDLAFSPERIDPGNPVWGVANTPKIVGGVTETSTARAAGFYGKFIETVVEASGTREAETAKLLENTFRHINIALVNEMARFCHELDIDLWEVIRCAATKPFGFQAFYPGPGVGGHCIPIDPNYLSHNVRARLGYPFRFVELAEEINATMPAYVAHRAQNLLNDRGRAMKGASVLLLGVAYKRDIADDRQSPAAPLARQLSALGAVVSYHDPHVTAWEPGVAVRRAEDALTAAASADLTILVQPHSDYDLTALAATARLLFDTRGATRGDRTHRL